MTDRFDPCPRTKAPLNRAVVIAIAVLVLSLGGVFAWVEARAAKNSMRAAMGAQAVVLAASFDATKIARLSGTEADLDTENYHYLHNQLVRIRAAHPAYRQLYLFGGGGGRPPFIYLASATQNSADYSPPGKICAEESPILDDIFETGCPGISAHFTDLRGTWVRTLVPVLDPQSGAPLAVLGMDVDAQDWRTEILRRAIIPAMITCMIALLTGAGTRYLRRRPDRKAKFGALQDSDRTAAETALRESERKYRLIAENAADVIFTMDMNFQFTYLSPSVQRISGFSPAEVMGRSLGQILTPGSLQEAYAAIERTAYLTGSGDFDHQLTIELELFRKDRSTYWTENEISFMFDESGKAIGIIGVTRDISRRRKAENELKKNEDRFRSMIQSASDMIFIIDANGEISYESPSAARILGYPEGHFLGKSPFTQIHPDDMATVTAEMELVSRSANKGLPTEFRLKTAAGGWTWLEALASNQFENPSIEGIIITARDIAERKRSEAEKEKLNTQLLQAKKMEAVGHLAGGIAHDFNNMLSVVMGQTEMIVMTRDDLDSGLRKSLSSIHEAARRSAELVRQLLGFARKQTINPQVLNINDTISGMLNMLRRLIGEDIEMTWTPAPQLSKIKIDPSQVDQILANLMVNARDAIDGVGKVTIRTGHAKLDEAYCSGQPGFLPGEYVVLTVSDSGCGMDKETLAQIFDPFFTTKDVSKGTGLGLATVYGIVKQNNGFINVYSEPGQGTTFRVYLPVIDALLDPAGLAAKMERISEGTGTILVVEDDAVLLDLNKTILEQLGYAVITAGTPAHAIELSQEHKSQIDLLITDVVMPQMSGLELVEHIRESTPELKCLYMSGYPADIIAHHGVLDEGIHFLQKPFSVREIAAKVREVIEQ